MKNFIYLVERKSDKKKFITYGNFKVSWNRPCAVFPFVSTAYEYAKQTVFGLVSNVSCARYNTKEFKVLYQASLSDKTTPLKYTQWGSLTKDEKQLLLEVSIPSNNGSCIISFKKFPLSIRGYYNENKKISICNNSNFF